MFTIFQLFEMTTALAGLFLGAYWGDKCFGVFGAVSGAIVFGYLGFIYGRLPGFLGQWWVKRTVQSKPSEKLRQELHGEQYYLFHLFLATLMMRGESIQSELGCILNLLRSGEFDKRLKGWANLQFAYPEMASKISDYDPSAPAETCRIKTATIADADNTER